jgi:hypothetical protein
MTDDELSTWKLEYSRPGLIPWATAGSDMEMYFCESEYLADALGISESDAETIISDVLEEHEEVFKKTFANKRSEINKRIYEKIGGSPSTDGLWATLPYTQRVKGKDLLSCLREKVRSIGHDEKRIGRANPTYVVAFDLVTLLRSTV